MDNPDVDRYQAGTRIIQDALGRRSYPQILKDGKSWPFVDRPMLEAEAHIIVFALNAVAEGKTLAVSPHWDHPWDFEPYSGPTAGVAP